jgi:hypothetical protein
MKLDALRQIPGYQLAVALYRDRRDGPSRPTLKLDQRPAELIQRLHHFGRRQAIVPQDGLAAPEVFEGAFGSYGKEN